MKTANTSPFRLPALVVATAFGALPIVPAASSAADTLTWMASPADANWNLSSFNWNSGALWTDGSDAIFPAVSSQKRIALSGTRTAHDVTLDGAGYNFSGALLKVTGKVTVNAATATFAAGFGGDSVRIGGPSTAIAYMGYMANNPPTVKTTYLEDEVVIAPNHAYCFAQAAPAAPTPNIVVTGVGPSIFFNNGTSANTMGSARRVRVAAGSTLHLGASGSISWNNLAAEPSPGIDFNTNSVVDVPGKWSGLVTLNPTVGTTNAIGRLSIGGRAKVTGGTTRLGAPKLATGAGALLYVDGNSSAFSATRGNFAVEGATLFASDSPRYVEVSHYGQVSVSGGGRVYMPGAEWLNGLNGPGRLTIGNGEFAVDTLRVSQSGSARSEVNLNEGGVMRVSQLRMDNASVATFAFNGGTFQSTRSVDARTLFTQTGSRWANVSFTVGEKGANFDTSNGIDIWWDRPLLSGAAADGGIRKTGAGILVFRAASAYTGPTVLESGRIQARVDHAVPDGTTLRLGGGADTKFSASTYETETPVRNTVQVIDRVEGSGILDNMTASTVTNSIAPSVGGVIEFETVCSLSGNFEISGDAAGCGRMKVAADQDISGLSLVAGDMAGMDADAETGIYTILDAPGGYTGRFAVAGSFPSDLWRVRYTGTAVVLVPVKPFVMVLR